MKAYIRSTAAVSPQPSLQDAAFASGATDYSGDQLACIEPDYSAFVDVKQIRRMSRILKMGTAAALSCLRQADTTMPDGIITGTAYGCLEDTAVFLRRLTEYKEELLPPTAFIQSTHNTVGAQIALLLQCHAYNNTIVHRGFSFEHALLDAMLLLKDQPGAKLLAGGIDEITKDSHAILARFGLYKKDSGSSLQLFTKNTKGTLHGEGAAFFLLTDELSEKNIASIDALETFYKPADEAETITRIRHFLSRQELCVENIDLLITGDNGDTRNDAIFHTVRKDIFPDTSGIKYKHLSGEYPTANAFACWLATEILRQKKIPDWFGGSPGGPAAPRKILIYNHQQMIHHSLILLSTC